MCLLVPIYVSKQIHHSFLSAGALFLFFLCRSDSCLHVSDVCERDFLSKLLRWIHLINSSRSIDVTLSNISQQKQREVKKKNLNLCCRTLSFLLSSPLNHLTTPQMYLVTSVGNHWTKLPNCV